MHSNDFGVDWNVMTENRITKCLIRLEGAECQEGLC